MAETLHYRAGMPVRKLSVAMDESIVVQAVAAAERHGVSLSAWLNAAAERALLLEVGLAEVRAWEDEHGDLVDEQLTWADSVLDRTVSL